MSSAALDGIRFFKMSGSGNDFVVIDGRSVEWSAFTEPEVVRALCARRVGIGADGVVILTTEPSAAFRMIYLNADGTRAEMCGNAALCSTRLAVELGMASGGGFAFATDSGTVRARMRDGLPEIDLVPVGELRADAGISLEAGEERMGFTRVGVPHLVVRCPDVESVDVAGRGARLRRDPSLTDGANVDFVAPADPERGQWAMRTFERGVETETLACGTGAVASALMLAAWGESGEETRILTRSGREVRVRHERRAGLWHPSLSGEGRIVYGGEIRELL